MKPSTLLIPLSGLLLSPAHALTEPEASAANTCFVASNAIEAIVQTRLNGQQKEEAKANVIRTFGAVNENLGAYLGNQVDQIYAQKPESLRSYGSTHNSSCLAQQAPTVNWEKAPACYLYARFANYLAQSRDKGATQTEVANSFKGASTSFQEMATLALKKVYENPASKFESLAEYRTCMDGR